MSTNCPRIYKENNNKKSSQPKLPLCHFSTLSTSDVLSLSLHLCFPLFLPLCSQSLAYADRHYTVEMSDRISIATEHTDTHINTPAAYIAILHMAIPNQLVESRRQNHSSFSFASCPAATCECHAYQSHFCRAFCGATSIPRSELSVPFTNNPPNQTEEELQPSLPQSARNQMHSSASLSQSKKTAFFTLFVLDSQTVMYVFMLRYISHNINF